MGKSLGAEREAIRVLAFEDVGMLSVCIYISVLSAIDQRCWDFDIQQLAKYLSHTFILRCYTIADYINFSLYLI